ncbi:geranylgeranyl reductase family protein [Oricola nitratireducens]|uniref:geranylgeranyl reductase family protein n=1 Tax=Oricola nitratireducens TaxID=2775868 RepID=UPI001868BB55|nr:geranylgeranyl reductase family protein [Oricola nitratireducens]
MTSDAGFDVDVLVVGLGPAGASAAAAAAEKGLSVLAIERNAEPGLPVQCAEFVPMMIGMQLPEMGDSRVQAISEMQTFIGGEEAVVTPDFRGYMVDRARFDQYLIAQAQKAGAQCRFATSLRGLDANGMATIGDGETVKAKLVIGADGPRSRVGEAIGAVNTELVETRQITLDLTDPHAATDIFLNAEIVGGYAWLFPRGDVCNLGLGVTAEHKARLKPLLDALHAQLVAEGRVGETIIRHTGGLIPVGGLVGPAGMLGETAVLLAGDAAGLTNPVTGAGIPSAVMSGKSAGVAAAGFVAGDADAPGDYAEELDDIFGPSLALALSRRREILDTYRQGGLPDKGDMRKSWIAFPQYWKKDAAGIPLSQTGQTLEATQAI